MIDNITTLIPTSPIPSHPSTEIIEQTIQSIRERLDGEIIIMVDGIRPEQEERRADYEEYTRRLLWLINNEWENIIPIVFKEHKHQANMTREALKLVKTPFILFVEHDTPLREKPFDIPFYDMEDMILSKEANVIRLMHEAHILEPHKYLMLDEGNRYTRTAQWSQRPHLALTEFYKQMIDTYFSLSSNTMIEDLIHGHVMNAYQTRGQAGWNDWKLWIYTPQGDMKRSLNLDGRQDDPKYEMRFE